MTENKPERGSQRAAAASQTWPRRVRTTMEPDREYEVGEAEYTELTRRGLIKSEGN